MTRRRCQHAWVHESVEVVDERGYRIESMCRAAHICWTCGAVSEESPPGTFMHFIEHGKGVFTTDPKAVEFRKNLIASTLSPPPERQ